MTFTVDDTLVAFISGLAGAILSLVASYFPKLNVWYAAKPEETKRLYMLVLLLFVAVLISFSSCFNWWVFIPCSKDGFKELVISVFYILTTNRVTFKFSPQVEVVREAKALS